MFCKSCGTQLPDNALFCENCGDKQETPIAEFTTEQVDEISEATPNAFAKAFGKIPAFIKSPANAVKDTDCATAGVLTGIFTVSIVVYLFVLALYKVVRFNSPLFSHGYVPDNVVAMRFGVILFGAILITIFAAATYIVPVMLARLVFVKDASFGKMVGDAFSEFSVYALPLAAGLLLAGFVAIISTTLASLTVTLFGIYYIISIIDSISLKIGGITGNIIKLLMVVGVVATLVVVSRFVFNGIANNTVNYDAYRLGSFIDRLF